MIYFLFYCKNKSVLCIVFHADFTQCPAFMELGLENHSDLPKKPYQTTRGLMYLPQ